MQYLVAATPVGAGKCDDSEDGDYNSMTVARCSGKCVSRHWLTETLAISHTQVESGDEDGKSQMTQHGRLMSVIIFFRYEIIFSKCESAHNVIQGKAKWAGMLG